MTKEEFLEAIEPMMFLPAKEKMEHVKRLYHFYQNSQPSAISKAAWDCARSMTKFPLPVDFEQIFDKYRPKMLNPVDTLMKVQMTHESDELKAQRLAKDPAYVEKVLVGIYYMSECKDERIKDRPDCLQRTWKLGCDILGQKTVEEFKKRAKTAYEKKIKYGMIFQRRDINTTSNIHSTT